MAEEIKEYLDLEGLSEYNKKRNELFQDLTIEEVEEAFNELDESDPSYSAFYDIITKAKEATKSANDNAEAASQATENAKTATGEANLATQAANKAADDAQKLIDSVNDMTTGINLIRGTRDFRQGTGTLTYGRYSDGFHFATPDKTTIEVDNDGFTRIKMYNPDNSSSQMIDCYGSLIEVNQEDKVFTISCEVMIDNYAEWNAKTSDFIVARTSDETITQSLNRVSMTFSKLGINNPQPGVWYPVKITLENTYAQTRYVDVILRVSGNASINFRKLMVQHGDINHPIYAPNPNDIGYINDITTGINLLRGTRDFRRGTTKVIELPNDGVYKDGWGCNQSSMLQSRFRFETDEFGFTTATIGNASTDSGYTQLFSSIIPVGNTDGQYTLSCKVKAADISALQGRACIIVSFRDETTEYIGSKNISLPSGTASDQLVNIVHQFDTPKNCKYFYIMLQVIGQSTVTYSRLTVTVGHIENLEWSASPFDIDYINDITTGINLLRGTRDIDLGSSNGKGQVFTDGFRMDTSGNVWSIEKLPDGFSCVKAHRTTTSSSNSYFRSSYFTNTGETIFTLSGELEVSVFYRDSATFARIVGLSESGTEVGNVGATYAQIGFDGSAINTPYKFKYTFDVSSLSSAKYYYVDFQFPSTAIATYRFYRLALYPGYIDNPEWSASPFDIAQISDISNKKQRTVTDKFSAYDGFEVVGMDIYQATPLVVQLSMGIKNINAMDANKEAKFGKLDTSICPVNNTPINGGWGAHGSIASSGLVSITPTSQVPAGTTNYFGAVYILNTPLT